jgi:hypothetical protein
MTNSYLGLDGDFFHIGVRVHDLQAAMEQLSAAHGITWATPQHRNMNIWLPEHGKVSWELDMTYSVEGPIHYELLQAEPGTLWHAGDQPGPHHFGYWVDDVQAETEKLIAQGWTLVMASLPPEEGYGRYSYVLSPQGILVEPVGTSARARFEAWWAGAELAVVTQ